MDCQWQCLHWLEPLLRLRVLGRSMGGYRRSVWQVQPPAHSTAWQHQHWRVNVPAGVAELSSAQFAEQNPVRFTELRPLVAALVAPLFLSRVPS